MTIDNSLDAILALAKSGSVEHLRMNVTPQFARDLLTINERNRNLRIRTAEKYARDMAAGQWLDTGDPIRVSNTGRLIDGQHRLKAVIISKTTVRFTIVVGIADEAQQAIDIGAKRPLGDALAIEGLKYAKVCTSISRKLYSYEAGRKNIRSFVASDAEIRSYIAENEEALIESARLVANVSREIPVRRSVVGALHFLCAEKDRAMADTFWGSNVCSGDEIYPGHPAKAFRQALLNRNGKGRFLTDESMFRLGIKAWNAYKGGREVMRLDEPRGPMPEIK